MFLKKSKFAQRADTMRDGQHSTLVENTKQESADSISYKKFPIDYSG